MSKDGTLKWGTVVVLLALGVLVSSAQALNFGDMMNPGHWWGGGTDRDRSAHDLHGAPGYGAPGYGAPGYGTPGPAFGPVPPGYVPYGQPYIPPFGQPRYAPNAQPHGHAPFAQPGRSLEGAVPPSRDFPTPSSVWGAAEDPFGARSPTMRDPWAAEDPAQQRIQELERRIQELERRHQDARGFHSEPRAREYPREPQWPEAQMREPQWPDAPMREPQTRAFSAPEFPPLDYQFPDAPIPDYRAPGHRTPEYPSQYQPLR